jgi:hypothetical protein
MSHAPSAARAGAREPPGEEPPGLRSAWPAWPAWWVGLRDALHAKRTA